MGTFCTRNPDTYSDGPIVLKAIEGATGFVTEAYFPVAASIPVAGAKTSRVSSRTAIGAPLDSSNDGQSAEKTVVA